MATDKFGFFANAESGLLQKTAEFKDTLLVILNFRPIGF
jgi:hypothetical protein